MPQYAKKKQNPFIKALVLLIALIFGVSFYSKVATTDVMEGFLSVFENSMTESSSQTKFSDEERDSVTKLVAGFWTYQTDTNNVIAIDDRIEITDNGYIWQVEQIQFTLPSGDKKNIAHVFHGFLYPSSKSSLDSLSINSVIRFLPQLWIYGNDTCEIRKYYGESREHKVEDNVIADYGNFVVDDFKDEAVDVLADGNVFKMGDRDYRPYKGKDIQTFFPAGLIEMVFNLTTAGHKRSTEQYRIKDKEVFLTTDSRQRKEIRLETNKHCTECLSLKDFLRKAITDDLQKATIIKREVDGISSLIREYYMPFCLKDELCSITMNPKFKVPFITISFDLTWQGRIENISIRVPGNAMDRKWRENEIRQEVQRWKFQPLEKESTPFAVTFTDTLTR